MTLGVVVIGRNEGERLVACLASIKQAAPTTSVVYVDSGSTDDSLKAAEAAGVTALPLDMSIPFTAARARNAGFAALQAAVPGLLLVQFIDGDCTLDPDWLQAAQDFLLGVPDVAIVCGRLREQYPDATIYNRLADAEWDTPVGQTDACGGIFMIRQIAFTQVDGFRPDLIAGEEPELCLRLRRADWKIHRLAQEMARHDIAMTRFSQWWKRTQRAGFTYAQGAALFGDTPGGYTRPALHRALVWGALLPAVIFGLALILWPLALLAVCVYPAQVLRVQRRGIGWLQAVFLTIGKFAEAQGALRYYWARLRDVNTGLVEYK